MKLIVYGTLMTGEANHHILRNTDAMYMCDVRVPNAMLFNLGAYPGMMFGNPGGMDWDQVIHGELWDVPEDMIGYLDAFEGVPHLYDRDECMYYIGDNDLLHHDAYIYEYQDPYDTVQGEYLIKSGNWKDR